MPLTFSIITCTWNSAAYLDASIASVLAQDYPHIEYIFVDGGSSDGTLERIRALRRPYRLLENVRGGISHAMNEGVRIATGDVVAHLHSDDYYLHGQVLSTVARHFAHPDRGWLFGRIKQDVGGELRAEPFIAPRYSLAQLLRRNFIPHPATFVRRELMLRGGGFDTALKYAMDYDLWLKLGRLSDPVQLDEPLAAFRVHEGSASTKNRLAAMEEDFQVRLAHAGPNPFTRGLHYTRYLVRRQQAMHGEMRT
jgi:cellulose synthase/poly-beta-1,6-N-acetylglucosamine synthase-like glycosyltransferase